MIVPHPQRRLTVDIDRVITAVAITSGVSAGGLALPYHRHFFKIEDTSRDDGKPAMYIYRLRVGHRYFTCIDPLCRVPDQSLREWQQRWPDVEVISMSACGTAQP